MWRGLTAAVAGCAVFLTVYVSLANVGLVSDELAAGSDAVLPCDSDGATIVYNAERDIGPEDRWEVTSVTVSGIAAACVGGTLRLVAINAAGVDLASGGPIIVNASSFSVDLSPDPDALSVAGVRLVIVGP